ncbi:TorF family putative porin [Xanthomonas sp. AM6]|uniref:TorF family putative porin n=1 Tax=Xanthomonas sp. AM6 TaxID=2982531 RepID=UPI0021D8792A|nr:TorF family putative porin [Xanthomonas sp. AM6]UYB51641.1 TorF family putative porin [Xanthomonas sp. AM6]
MFSPLSRIARRPVSRGALALSLLAGAASAHAASVSGNATLTSDYVWRGSTQSDGDPAVQAGLALAADNGAYASLWASSIRFDGTPQASTEIDGVLGWRGQWSPDWAWDANLTRYQYPSAAALNWTELGATVTWKQRVWAQLGWSDDALASDSTGTYAQLGARYPFNERVRVEAAVGRYWLARGYADSYSHGLVSAVFTLPGGRPGGPGLELRLTAHDSDRAAERLFPGMAGGRVEAALQATF